MTVVTICVRLDAFAIIYCVFLGLLLCLNRRGCFIVWPVYMIVLTILLTLQYLGVLGAPPVLCWGRIKLLRSKPYVSIQPAPVMFNPLIKNFYCISSVHIVKLSIHHCELNLFRYIMFYFYLFKNV